MSEQKSNNDSAPGTFSFFETFQSSGDAIPSLDSISLSGELPQLPTSPPPVTEQPVTEQPVTNEPEPVGVGERESVSEDVGVVGEVAAEDIAVEPVVAEQVEIPETAADVQSPPVVTPQAADDDDDYEIDPVLRPPVVKPPVVNPTAAKPTTAAKVKPVAKAKSVEPAASAPVADVVQEATCAVAESSQPVVEAAPVVAQPVVTPPVGEDKVPTVESATEVVEQETKPTADADSVPESKPLTVEAIVAAAAARVRATDSTDKTSVQPAVTAPVAAAAVTTPPAKKMPVAAEETAAPKPVAAPEPVVSEPVATQPAVVESPVQTSAISPEAGSDASDGKVKFAELPLSDHVQAAVQQSGYDTPTEIQAQIIPHMLEGRDVLAQSQTGTGKTAAFALPILSRIKTEQRTTQVLVLAPTRELAMQVADSFETYGAQVPGFQVAAIYGGAGYENQIRQLKRASVVVGTPGRVIDHIKKGTLKLGTLDCLVLDEADEMLNMGFLEDVQFVLEKTPANRQVALFSATMPVPIRNIADRYLNAPIKITVKQKTMTAEAIRQRAAFVSPRDKMEVLARFLEVEETDGCIVFARTREGTATVADELNARGFKAAALNGDMPQQVRERTVDHLKAGRLNIVVATDVAARGLDVPRIRHVFNYDVPMDNESYIHRIGRTGRAGKKGHAILFVTGGQKNRLRSIERATRQPIEIVQVPTADEVNEVRKKTFLAAIDKTVEERDLSFFKQMLHDHAETSGADVVDIAAALADQLQQGRSFFAAELPKARRRDNEGGRDRNDRGGRDRFDRNDRGGQQDRRRKSGPARGGMQRYRIEVGRADNVKPGNIVGAVANEGGIDGDQIGPISIYDDYSTVDLPDGMPADIFQLLRKVRVAGKQLQLTRASPSDDQEQKRFGGGKKFGDRNGGGGRRFGGHQGGSGGGFKGKNFAKKKFRRD